MAFFPRFVQSEFAPMFRLLDDYSAHVANSSRGGAAFGNSLRSFNPKFDVKETKEGYTLEGELPGVDQENVTVEWTDHNTLQIKGRSERRREEGTRPSTIEAAPEKEQIADTESNGSYHKATVEDEYVAVDANSTAEATPAATPAATEAATETPDQPQQTNASKWWVSERSVGEFSRSFSFPNRIDQENVKASLQNGILSIAVPKASAPETRRINIE